MEENKSGGMQQCVRGGAEARLILHVPGLQARLAEGLPGGVRFLAPGLPGTTGPESYVPESLPLAPSQARACLEEMLAMGAQFRHPRDMITLALQPEDTAARESASLHAEMADLDRFVADTEHLPIPSEVSSGAEDTDGQSALAAQKTLILAWELESRLQELHALHAAYAQTASAFRGVMGVDEDDELAELAEPSGLRGVNSSLSSGQSEEAADAGLMAWRTVVDALLRFAPPEASFLTEHPLIVAAATECVAPVPPDADLLAALSPASAVYGLCRVPAWKLLGHTRCPADRPWLDRELSLLLCKSRETR